MNKPKLSKVPSVTVIMATFNSSQTIEKSLLSIKNQIYPKKKIDIILADGGSKDRTLLIGKKYGAKIIKIPPKMQNAEYNKGQALKKAKGDLVLMMDHDNVLPHNYWLAKMVKPLVENKEMVATETLRYHYDPKFSLLDRYFALFGAGDPLAFYMGKADRLSYIYKKYNLFGKATRKKGYYSVVFDKRNIPTLGANGFLIRRNILIDNAKTNGKDFFHIDVNVDLIRKGFTTYGFVDDTIIHLTGYNKISKFLYRRKLFMEQYYFKKNNKRRYSVYEKRDFLKLIYFIIISTTFVIPTIDAVRGYIQVRDKAWFFHPVLSFSLCAIYAYTTIKNLFFRA